MKARLRLDCLMELRGSSWMSLDDLASLAYLGKSINLGTVYIRRSPLTSEARCMITLNRKFPAITTLCVL